MRVTAVRPVCGKNPRQSRHPFRIVDPPTIIAPPPKGLDSKDHIAPDGRGPPTVGPRGALPIREECLDRTQFLENPSDRAFVVENVSPARIWPTALPEAAGIFP